MGRVTVHLHGRPRGLGTKDLIESYGKRISSSGIDIEIHSDKASNSDYQDRIETKSGKLILLDESGDQFTSLEIASLLSDVAISGENLNFAIGPVEGFDEEFNRSPKDSERVWQGISMVFSDLHCYTTKCTWLSKLLF